MDSVCDFLVKRAPDLNFDKDSMRYECPERFPVVNRM